MKPELDLASLTIEQVKRYTPDKMAEMFGLRYISVALPDGMKYALFRIPMSSNDFGIGIYQEHDTFLISGITVDEHEMILFACLNGKVVPPGELKPSIYTKLNHKQDKKAVAQYNQQKLLTDMLKEVIPESLVGGNPSLDIALRTYSDDFMQQINKTYPLESILGDRKLEIASGKTKATNKYIPHRLLENFEAESFIASILQQSAKAGSWQPEITTPAELKAIGSISATEVLEEIGVLTRVGDDDSLFDSTVFRAKYAGLVIPTQYEQHLIVLPSQKCIEFFATRR